MLFEMCYINWKFGWYLKVFNLSQSPLFYLRSRSLTCLAKFFVTVIFWLPNRVELCCLKCATIIWKFGWWKWSIYHNPPLFYLRSRSLTCPAKIFVTVIFSLPNRVELCCLKCATIIWKFGWWKWSIYQIPTYSI